MGWELHAGEGGEAPEPWVSKNIKLHAGILSPSSGSNPDRLRVTPQGVLSLLSHTFTPSSGLQLAATLIPLNIISLGLHPRAQAALHCSSRLTLPSRSLCPFLSIWTHTSFVPLCFPLRILPPPSPASPLWCSPRPAFTLGSAFLDSVVYFSGSSWWPGIAALLT